MSLPEPARRVESRRRPAILVVALVVVATLVAVVGHSAVVSSRSADPSPQLITVQPADGPPVSGPHGHHDGAPVEPRLAVPDGTTVFADDVPAVTRLDPDLLTALRRAATEAAGDGVTFHVNSGWRSRQDQEQLFREAVRQYGSRAEAARWVAVPGTSSHEAGKAVDLGESDATRWLAGRGARYGLCQIYRNEPWHYELRPRAMDHACPPTYADPTQDPRMRR